MRQRIRAWVTFSYDATRVDADACLKMIKEILFKAAIRTKTHLTRLLPANKSREVEIDEI
jgi:uncharacterized protein YaiI (UPF0178 family)